MMAPKSHCNLLRGPRCKYCTRKFQYVYINRFLQHLNRHQKHIKPYWYTKSNLPPKAGCVKIKRRGKLKYFNEDKMKKLKEPVKSLHNYKKCKEEAVTSDSADDDEEDIQHNNDKEFPKEHESSGQKTNENAPGERSIWKDTNNLYCTSKEQNVTDERNIHVWSTAPWKDLTRTDIDENERDTVEQCLNLSQTINIKQELIEHNPETQKLKAIPSTSLQSCKGLITKENSFFDVSKNEPTSDDSDTEQEITNQENGNISNDLNIHREQEATKINLQTQETKAKFPNYTNSNDKDFSMDDVNTCDIKSEESDMSIDTEEEMIDQGSDQGSKHHFTDLNINQPSEPNQPNFEKAARNKNLTNDVLIAQDHVEQNLHLQNLQIRSSRRLQKLKTQCDFYDTSDIDIEMVEKANLEKAVTNSLKDIGDLKSEESDTDQQTTEEMNRKQRSPESNKRNFQQAAKPNGEISLSIDQNITQKQDLNLKTLRVRSSRRLRKGKSQNNDLQAMSDTELEMNEEANFERAVENSLKDVHVSALKCEECYVKSERNDLKSEESDIDPDPHSEEEMIDQSDLKSEGSYTDHAETEEIIDKSNENISTTNLNIKQEPSEPNQANSIAIAMPDGTSITNLSNDMKIKQEHVEHNFNLQNLQIRSSRRLRKRNKQNDIYDSEIDLELIEQDNFQKAVENSLKDVINIKTEDSGTEQDTDEITDAPNENLFTNLNRKQKPSEPIIGNAETAVMSNVNKKLSCDLNIKQEHVEQNFTLQNLQRSSRRLRKHKTQNDLYDISETDLEMIEQDKFQKADDKSLKDVQATPANSRSATCDICVVQVAISDLLTHDGVKVCKECFQMLTNISENATDDVVDNNVDGTSSGKLEMVETESPATEDNAEKNFEAEKNESKSDTEMDMDYLVDEKSADESSDSEYEQDKAFKCDLCSKRFPTNKSKRRHERNTHMWYGGSQKALKLKKIEMKNDLIQKKKEEMMRGSRQDVKIRFRKGDLDPSKPFKCAYCPKRFSTKCSKQRHAKIHSPTYCYKCSYCDKSFYRIELKRYHELEHTGVKAYKCSFCEMTFKTEGTVKIHERIHRNDRRFKCEHCDKRFYERRDLDRHQVKHTGAKPYSCNLCDKKFAYENGRDIHMRKHTGTRPHKCRFCVKSFYTSSHRTNHEMIHTNERPVSCDYCDKTFRTNGCKASHERTHTGETPFKCQFCDKRFMHANLKRNHERLHTGEKIKKTHKCNFCSKTFYQLSLVKSHERVHTGVKPYICRFCPKQFSQTSARTIHERIHTGEKPYKCQKCPAKFTNLSSLKVHDRGHTGEKTFKCNFCFKSFRRKHHKESHELTHKDERPHKCTFCEKAFKSTAARDSHIRIHTGVKPYKCTACDKTFRCSDDLYKHKQIHSEQKNYKCRVCLKGFRDKRNLLKHERAVHEHVKDYQCSFCPQRFSDAGGKRSHERLHTGEMPYQCAYCELKFRHASSWRIHERKHTGEQPYKCSKCGKIYSDSRSLKRHEKSCH